MEKRANNTGSLEDPDLRILTQELLTNARALLEEIQEMVEWCSSILTLRPRKREQSVHVATIREDGETLVIDGFRFEDAVSREDLGRQSEQEGKTTHD